MNVAKLILLYFLTYFNGEKTKVRIRPKAVSYPQLVKKQVAKPRLGGRHDSLRWFHSRIVTLLGTSIRLPAGTRSDHPTIGPVRAEDISCCAWADATFICLLPLPALSYHCPSRQHSLALGTHRCFLQDGSAVP